MTLLAPEEISNLANNVPASFGKSVAFVGNNNERVSQRIDRSKYFVDEYFKLGDRKA